MTSYGNLGQSDYEAQVPKLLPRGFAWLLAAGGVMREVWLGIADFFALIQANINQLTEVEAFPPTSVQLLPDWEEALGLPDPCLPTPSVTSARQAAVAARIAATGGQSVQYFLDLAQSLGAADDAITITQYAPFRWGVDTWGAPWRTTSWAYTFLVTMLDSPLFRFQWGGSSWGEPFWQYAPEPIQCEISRLKPAHTLALFTGFD